MGKDPLREEKATFSLQPIDVIASFVGEVLGEWRADLEARGSWLHTPVGKQEWANFRSSKKWLKRFFRCHEELEPSVTGGVAEMMSRAAARDYKEANDSYFKITIGNGTSQALGIFSVGIHPRAVDNRRKREAEATHCMDDERTKQILLAFKRLLSYCERKRPPAAQ